LRIPKFWFVPKIDDVYELNGEIFKCVVQNVDSTPCDGCHFFNDKLGDCEFPEGFDVACDVDNRKDKVDVIFHLLNV